MNQLLGAVEAGGTKFRCAVVSSDMTVVESVRVPTTDPDATLAAVASFFQQAQPVAALGIASFGPRRPGPRLARLRRPGGHAQAGMVGQPDSGAPNGGSRGACRHPGPMWRRPRWPSRSWDLSPGHDGSPM